jgi:hypothetical protein
MKFPGRKPFEEFGNPSAKRSRRVREDLERKISYKSLENLVVATLK